MARFGDESVVPGLTTIDSSMGLGLKVDEIDLQTKQVDYDPMADLSAAFEQARGSDAGKDSDSGLRVSDLPDFSAIMDIYGSGQLNEAQQALQEAQALIQQEKFEEALKILITALNDDDCRWEACYLRGFCFLQLQQSMEALRALKPLRGVRLDSDLDTRVTQLRTKVGTIVLMTLLPDLLFGGGKSSTGSLRELTELDPENGFYWFMHAVTLMKADRIDEAQTIVDRGLALPSLSDRQRLVNLGQELERRHLRVLLAPAVQAYKQAEYRKAHSLLAKAVRGVDTEKHPILSNFMTYLGSLSGGGGLFGLFGRKASQGKLPPPPGTSKEQEELHFLLVGAELKEAEAKLKAGRPALAHSALEAAYQHAPHFPYLNFMLAISLYRDTGEAMQRAKGDFDPAEMERRLEETLKYCSVAMQDPELTNARELHQQIFGLVSAARDARAVKDCFSEFNEIAEGKRKVDPSRLPAELKRIQDKAKKAQIKVEQKQAKDALQNLINGIEQMLKQVSSAASEAGIVQKHMEAFKTAMDNAAKSPSTLKSKLQRIQSDARNSRRKVTSDQARTALDQLCKSIDDVIRQVEQANSDGAILKETVQRFNDVMNNMDRYRGKPLELFQELEEIKQTATRKQSECRSSQAKEALANLVNTINDIERKIAGIK